MKQLPLLPFDAFRARLAERIERRAAEARLEIALAAERARRSIGQRNRRFLEKLLAGRRG